MRANAHRVLFGADGHGAYLHRLTVDEGRKRQIKAARDEIRKEIWSGLRNWRDHLGAAQLFEAGALTSSYLSGSDLALRPQFRMQGSWFYHTLNRPIQSPPQTIDLDDGVFLPISFPDKPGGPQPILSSAGYFALVERILAPVCATKGWMLITDRPSCVRVQIASDAHIDLALYAIPDVEFEALLAQAAVALQFDAELPDESTFFAEHIYPFLPAGQLRFAHRRDGWVLSDPRALEDWFQEAVDWHGPQILRVCRYLKGWRDHHWTTCRLHSMVLMACVATAYDEAALVAENRDDLALAMVARRLPELLNRRVPNPVAKGQFLDESWSAECRADFIAGAHALAARIEAALEADRPSEVLAHLRAVLGADLPCDEDLVLIEVSDGAPSSSQAGTWSIFPQLQEQRPIERKLAGDACPIAFLADRARGL